MHSRVKCQNCRSLVYLRVSFKKRRYEKQKMKMKVLLDFAGIMLGSERRSGLSPGLVAAQLPSWTCHYKAQLEYNVGYPRKKRNREAKLNLHDQCEEAAVLVRERANRAVQKVPSECCPELPPAQAMRKSGRFSHQNSLHLFGNERTIAWFHQNSPHAVLASRTL